MKGTVKSGIKRVLPTLAVVASMLLVAGDSAVRSAPPPGWGIDPFEVLDLQVKSNVLIIFDTSGSMSRTLGGTTVGSDDALSRMFKAKQATKAVLTANQGNYNFGFATYNLTNSNKELQSDGNGPLLYVSTSAQSGASLWTDDDPDFFGTLGDDGGSGYLNTSATDDQEVYDSFERRTFTLAGDGCTPTTTACRKYLYSRLFRNNVRFTWDTGSLTGSGRPSSPGSSLTAVDAIDCSAFPPPAGLFPADAPGLVRPCVQHRRSGGGPPADRTTTFWYSTGRWTRDTGDSCDGSAVLEAVADCAADTVPQLLEFLKPALPLEQLDVSGNPTGSNGCGGTRGELCAIAPAPLNGTATAIQRTNPAGVNADTWLGIIAVGSTPLGKSLEETRNNFATIFPSPTGLEKNFVILLTDGQDTCTSNADAAAQAGSLYNGGAAPYAETLVIGFGTSTTNLNAIARAGSGGARDAFPADDTAALIDAINGALALALPAGIFSGTQSVFDAVPEYVATVGAPYDPLDPVTRYKALAFRSYRANFDSDGFQGFVRAFDSTGEIAGWEAGQKLLDERIAPILKTSDRTFSEVQGDIQRRIFTTSRNGVGPPTVMLWPPGAGVAPTANGTAGSLDDALFRKADGTLMTQSELEVAPFRACLGGNLPPDCTSGDAAVKLAVSRREAREMVLAYTAGAAVVPDTNGDPTRNGSGEVVYRARPGVLAESTIGAPAVVTPPMQAPPAVYGPEYILMRDGPRDAAGDAVNAVDAGYGLRNPDADGQEGPTGSLNRPALKPVMSVLYVPTNDMLEAFRAGPQVTGTETGGEELWGHVPYDLLPKLRRRMLTQNRGDHTYMMSSSVRFAMVFEPGTVTVAGATYAGRWRRVLMVGRGPGGKYYSALDITAPGPFTRSSLATNLPTVLWARGNPDTQDGRVGGPNNGSLGDLGFYDDMGLSWSTPAIAYVQGATPEHLAFVGSGYGTEINEGSRFYTLNVFNGDIVASDDVSDVAGATFENALVANPATYAANQLRPGIELPNPAGSHTSAVYVGDIHGRMWKFDTGAPGTSVLLQDVGVDQPIGSAAALLNLDDEPYVFFNTGNDVRVPEPASGFEMWAIHDEGVSPGTLVPPFPVPYPGGTADNGPYRGTLAPLSAFLDRVGVVFFVGTRFNPGAPAVCLPSFDSIIFGLFALDGTTAYDTIDLTGVKVVGMPHPPIDPPGPPGPPIDEGTPSGGTLESALPPAPQIGQPVRTRYRVVRPNSSVVCY